jgi:hypothetical protein
MSDEEGETAMASETPGPQAALHITTRVQPGNKIEIIAPELIEGEAVEVFLVLPRQAEPPRRSALEIIAPLPPGPRSYPSWEEFERRFQEERDSWERGRYRPPARSTSIRRP